VEDNFENTDYKRYDIVWFYVINCNQINSSNIEQWFESVDRARSRFEAYYAGMREMAAVRK
jgi:hypothetical protein